MAHKFEKYYDMPLKRIKGEEHIPHKFANILHPIMWFIMKAGFRFKVVGIENVRGFNNKSGVLVIGNHTSSLDVAFNAVALQRKQWPRYMAKEEHFTVANGVVGWMFSRYGAFPVKRDSADRSSIKRAVTMLKNGEVVTILPEGTRRGRGTKEIRLHAGAALVAKMANVPIVPLCCINAEKIKEKGKRIHFPQVIVEYGKPMLLKDFDMLPKADRLEGCTWYVMRSVFSMFTGLPEEEVNMKELFPLDRDFTEEFRGVTIPRYTPEEALKQLSLDK